VEEAVAEAAELVTGPDRSAGEWQTLACVYALASDRSADRKKAEYADRAVALLRKAVAAGLNRSHLIEDKDLDPLRGRDDFQKLVAEVEAKAEKVPETAPPPRENQ
jgi:hypothetical protein